MTKAYGAQSPLSKLEPLTIKRREPGSHDVSIKILYCGICHSDIHMVRNEWKVSNYPIVPGHEIIGKVTKVGADVKKIHEGDIVGVGCMVGSCGQCEGCNDGCEQYCDHGAMLTYNSPEKETNAFTYGGYSDDIVVNEKFVLNVPDGLDIKAAAPLLCAGITTYSPLMHWKVNKNSKVAVVGLGGLGHMAVKIAHAMGAHVTMITTSAKKEADAKRLGADEVLLSTDAKAMAKHANHFDFILNTIPRTHDVNPYIDLLKRDGTMVMVGAVEPIQSGFDSGKMIFRRKTIAGSLIGGIKETQEMLDFCAKHNVLPDVEMISADKINEAYERMLKNDVKYRFVIDMATL
ncbi:MAG TPA: NAD(P)-dependent alcohol dehydrogenase [Gammaproteobacteria bacterium]|jgi:uncharacterized zinc-type alcohol dehydrogenase-like protein|nr:NAD(P)-dependent alcohol dehydrogenase [Gammaproteobacteria bacterium]